MCDAGCTRWIQRRRARACGEFLIAGVGRLLFHHQFVAASGLEMNVGMVVFARMGSQRFPGKMLQAFGSVSLLEWVLRRARELPYPLLTATSELPADDPIAEASERLGVSVFRGAEADVLGRALACAHCFGFDAIARICGDRPLFDVDELGGAIERMRLQPTLDLISNNVHGAAPAGLTTEVVRTSALERASQSTAAHDREHVTPYLYAHPELFRIHALSDRHRGLQGHRFAVDSAEDLARLAAAVAATRKAAPSAREVAAALRVADAAQLSASATGSE